MLTRDLSRRALLAAGAGTGLAALGAGCGSAGTNGASVPATTQAPSGASRTLTHKYGTTTVTGTPQRIVTLGYTDQEPFLALGVQPVGVVDFFKERPYGKWAWESPRWAGQQPQVIGDRDEYAFEKIAALRPDLIVGLYSGMTKDSYTKLSAIAPTVAQPTGHEDFAAPWTVITEVAGQCVGRAAAARSLVAAVEKQFASVRSSHPHWAGTTTAVVEPAEFGEWAVFGAGDPKIQFMQGLGFRVAPSVREIEPGGDVGKLSTERLDELDVGRLVVLIDSGDQTQAQIEANPLYRKLGVAREHRTLFTPFEAAPAIGAALSFNSVLSIPYGITHGVAALDRLDATNGRSQR